MSKGTKIVIAVVAILAVIAVVALIAMNSKSKTNLIWLISQLCVHKSTLFITSNTLFNSLCV